MTVEPRECIGCPDPDQGDVFDFCLVHGTCEGCPNPERGDITRGDLVRSCPMHGVVAGDLREEVRRQANA